MITIIVHSDKAQSLAQKILDTGFAAEIIRSPKNIGELFTSNEALIFIGSLGICVREIAPFLKNKKNDPAVVNIDPNGNFVQSVISGHVGGANKLAEDIARLLGATPIVTTVSDTSNLWALDLLPNRFGWKMECTGALTKMMADFVNEKKTAILLEARDNGTFHLESTLPGHAQVFTKASDLKAEDFDLIIAVTPFLYNFGVHTIYYRPAMVHLGVGCQKDIECSEMLEEMEQVLEAQKISKLSVASLATVDLKKDEPALVQIAKDWNIPLQSFNEETLAKYQVPNPSVKVNDIAGTYSVSEAAAMHVAENVLLIEKTKLKAGEKHFTLAAAIDKSTERKGHVEFVGAGPGDPELVSVRGKKLLQTADYILYAGSLVPEELTHYAKPGCVVESSAAMDLETQLNSMKPYYDRGLSVVRLHTGDPCIYGAIQEQMAIMDSWGWNYKITPGISSFQAAAAALKSQFTIPEEIQTIILTRGEGRTPMPEREQMHKLAQSQSTMCIYLSASIAEKVQKDLSVHYPPETPVAICYKLTWKDEKVYRCTVSTLAQTVKENNLKMTTLIVVGKAIDNRLGTSKLYDQKFKHAFRERK